MINKFQQGGIIAQIQQLPKEQQQQIMQAFSQWAQQKGLDINQLQKDPQTLEQALGQFMQEMQSQQTRAARHGAKLQYLKSLKNQCAEDEELYYYKKGGSVGCGCKKKEDGGEIKKAQNGAVAKFKNDQKKKQQQQQQQKPKWTDTKDNELRILSGKKNLTPQEQKRLQQLRNEFKNSSNTKDYELEEGKKGMKVEKSCGGAAAKFKKYSSGGFVKANKDFELDPIGYTDFLNQNGINPKRVATKYVYTDVEKKGGKVKKGKTCPKCGKVHAAGTGCAVAKFKKHRQGGSLNGISFISRGHSKVNPFDKIKN